MILTIVPRAPYSLAIFLNYRCYFALAFSYFSFSYGFSFTCNFLPCDQRSLTFFTPFSFSAWDVLSCSLLFCSVVFPTNCAHLFIYFTYLLSLLCLCLLTSFVCILLIYFTYSWLPIVSHVINYIVLVIAVLCSLWLLIVVS